MIEEKQTQPKNKEKKKLSPTGKAIIIVIMILAAALILYFRIGSYIKDLSELIFIITFIVVLVLITLGLRYAKKKGFLFKIGETFKVLFLNLWLPLAVFIIMLLGSIHQTYPYESGWEKNMTASLGYMGQAGISLFNQGAEFPLWALLLIIASFFYFSIEEIIQIWKKPNKTKEEMEREERERKAKLPWRSK